MGIAQVFWEMLEMMFNICLFISLAFVHHVRCGDCCTDASLCDPTTIIQESPESPYFGTVDVLPGLITKKDKSVFKKSKKAGAGTVQMWQGDSLQESLPRFLEGFPHFLEQVSKTSISSLESLERRLVVPGGTSRPAQSVSAWRMAWRKSRKEPVKNCLCMSALMLQ